MFNNNRIQTTVYGLDSEKVGGEIVIAHLSDLHEKEFGKGNQALFHKVSALQPDVIAVTGDLVAHENQKHADTTYTFELANGLSAIAPTFFVTGNHERAFDEEITEALLAGSVNIVRQGVYTMDIRGNRMNISGMDDLSYETHDPAEALDIFCGMDGFNLFLTHRPEVYEDSLGKNIDLILAGHTHAGQIRIPGVSRLYMPGQGFFPKYVQGEFTDGDTTMIISRGLGSSGYPSFRINNPPDLVAVYVDAAEESYATQSSRP